MKKNQHTKFIWCPVCMVHTYHRRENDAWECLGEGHDSYLKLRQDPWIEAYKKEQARRKVALEEKV